jgi:hypothetical protein
VLTFSYTTAPVVGGCWTQVRGPERVQAWGRGPEGGGGCSCAVWASLPLPYRSDATPLHPREPCLGLGSPAGRAASGVMTQCRWTLVGQARSLGGAPAAAAAAAAGGQPPPVRRPLGWSCCSVRPALPGRGTAARLEPGQPRHSAATRPGCWQGEAGRRGGQAVPPLPIGARRPGPVQLDGTPPARIPAQPGYRYPLETAYRPGTRPKIAVEARDGSLW